MLLVFSLTRSRHGDVAALASAFIYSFGFPLVVFVERAFLNEALLMCLTFAVLVAVDRRTRGAGLGWLLVAAAGMACIGAVKPTFLIVSAGVFALYLERDRLRGLLRLEPYAIVACGIVGAALWLSWAAALGQTTGLTFGLTDKLFDAGILFDHGYWVKITRRLVKDLFGPIGIVAAAIGLIAVWRARRMMEIALLLGGVAYLIVVTPGNYHHDYYQIPLVSGVAVLAGVGLTRGLDGLDWFRTRSPRSQLAIRVMAFWLLPMTTLVRSASPHNWYQIDVDRAALCDELRPALHSDDLVAFLSQQNPDVMFCTWQPRLAHSRRSGPIGSSRDGAPRRRHHRRVATPGRAHTAPGDAGHASGGGFRRPRRVSSATREPLDDTSLPIPRRAAQHATSAIRHVATFPRHRFP